MSKIVKKSGRERPPEKRRDQAQTAARNVVRVWRQHNAHAMALKNLASTTSSGAWTMLGLGKDSKEPVPPLAQELALFRKALRSIVGTRPFRTLCPMTFTLTATVTSGLVTAVSMGGTATGIIPSNLAEASAFISVFDEVKVHGGYVDFLYNNPVTAGAAITTDSLPTIGFDPDDSSPLGSSIAVQELQQHKTFDPNTTGSTATSLHGNHHRFSFKTMPGDLTVTGGQAVGDAWQEMATGARVGCIKFYHVGQITTAIVVGAGTLMLDVSFRSRQ